LPGPRWADAGPRSIAPGARDVETGGNPISVNTEPVSDAAIELLVEAGVALATSLDLTTTMGQVARLTVPRLADLCVIDLLDEDGSIRDVAVAAADERIARGLEELRGRYQLDPAGEHPVARVIRSGEPILLPQMTSELLSSFAQGSEHARFMIDNDYRSAAVAPLLARERTLGAISVLRLGNGRSYESEDLDLVCELARRAALAIDNARLFSRLRGVERRLEAILVNLAEAITVMDEHGQMVFANQAAADLLGAGTPAELMRAEPGTIMPRFQVLDEQGRELELESMPGRRLFAGEREPEPLLVRNIVRATGEERWLVVRSSPVIDPETKRIVFAVNVFENITEVKRAQLTESFMAEASRVLASSMDYGETLRRVTRLAVPRLADWCAIDVLNDRGEIELVAVHHADSERLAMAERIDRRYRPTLDDPTGVAEVLRTGQARIFTDIPPDAVAAYAHDGEHLQLLRTIGPEAVIIVPMIGARTVGTITLISSEPPRRLTSADLPLAERLARRAGTAVERARLFTERSRIAHILERSLLPESLPDVPGVEVQARYSPAGEVNEVGGDFYDLFECQTGRWMLVIGDVCGKGPRAAGVTALARHTLRAAALSDQSPAEMLRTLHRALRLQPPGADLCTVSLVQMTPGPDHARLTVALAGHQPPLLIDRNGDVAPLGEPGTLLGVVDPIDLVERDAELHGDQTLLMYTDGVTEAGRAGRQLGEQGLRGLCAQTVHLALDGMLEHIEHAVLERAAGRLRDDVALLAVRLNHTGPARGDGPPRGAGEPREAS
jgi:PAS domain S-box-containing protein